MNTLIEQIEAWLTQLIDKRVREQKVDDVRKIVDEQISQINNMQLLADASKQRIQEVVIECLDTYDFDDHINDVLYTADYQDADQVISTIEDRLLNQPFKLTLAS